MASVVTASVLVVVGCAARSAPEQGAPSPPRAQTEAPPAAPPTAPAQEPVGLALRPLTRPSFVPADFRFVTPRAAEPVTLDRAGELIVTLEGRSEGVLVALDGHAFRAFPGEGVPLGRLLLEDEEIAPGPHRLVALRDEGTRRAVAVTWFWVHEGATSSPAVPEEPPPGGVVLVAPRGTYNGERAADAVRIDAFALASSALVAPTGERTTSPVDSEAALRVRMAGPGGAATQVTRGESLAVQRLESGDHGIEVTRAPAVGGRERVGEGPWGVAHRIITVNRDLEPPEAP